LASFSVIKVTRIGQLGTTLAVTRSPLTDSMEFKQTSALKGLVTVLEREASFWLNLCPQVQPSAPRLVIRSDYDAPSKTAGRVACRQEWFCCTIGRGCLLSPAHVRYLLTLPWVFLTSCLHS
jgi:hypothetical protein